MVFCVFFLNKLLILGSGERAQQLTVLAALSEDLGLIPSTHITTLSYS